MSEELKRSCSDLSVDSLETGPDRPGGVACKKDSEEFEKFLVPFYDGEVLMSVRKDSKGSRIKSPIIIAQGTTNKNIKPKKPVEKQSKDIKFKTEDPKNYLVNKIASQKQRKNKTYLEKFREKLTINTKNETEEEKEIESVYAEYGDTERESIGEGSASVTDFYNTECYNEVFYESLINQDYDKYSNPFEEVECDAKERKAESTESSRADERLRSASEVVGRRSGRRRAATDNVPTCRLGGLGPDMEKIRPRLERARSLQRYSEKVRIENKLKIYNRTLQELEETSKQTKVCPVNQEKPQNTTALKNLQKSSYLVQSNREEHKKMANGSARARDQNSANSRSKYNQDFAQNNTKPRRAEHVRGSSLESGQEFGENSTKSKFQMNPPFGDAKSIHKSFKCSNLANYQRNNEKMRVNASRAAPACAQSRGDERQYDLDIKYKTRGCSPRITVSSADEAGVNIVFQAEGEGDEGGSLRVRGGRVARGEGALGFLEEKHRLFQEAVRKMCPTKKEA